METKKVTVLALARGVAGAEERLLAELLALVAPTRREAGCLKYDLHRSPDDPTAFMFYETWETREALDAHLDSPHLAAFDEHAGDLLAAPVEITIWELVS